MHDLIHLKACDSKSHFSKGLVEGFAIVHQRDTQVPDVFSEVGARFFKYY
jgi:hypothetical protein